MCGITAITDIRQIGEQHATSLIARMSEEMDHRGQDERVIRIHGNSIVAYNRMAINNVGVKSPGEYWCDGELKCTVYLNGEIYNYQDLAAELQCSGSKSEAEVLARGFYEVGTHFVNSLNGMFLIVAIISNEMHVFRDRYGEKPGYLHISHNQQTSVIASEIKPILRFMKEFKEPVKMNPMAKSMWLACQNEFSNYTMFDEIIRIPRASHGIVGSRDKPVGFFTYWHWKIEQRVMQYPDAVAETRRLVEQAVKRMLPRENLGICLSGGIDSGILAKLTSAMDGVSTFTCRYYSDGEDEGALAELSASKTHYEILYKSVQHLPETVRHLEDLRMGASWSNYGLYKLMSKYARIGFDGAGADELFGGYMWRYDLSRQYWEFIIRSSIADPKLAEALEAHRDYPDQSLGIRGRWLWDMNHFLQGVLLVVDRLSMAHTVEMRTPFLDNDLVDFALTIPDEFRQNKMLLKDAFRDLLPTGLLRAPKKGWSSPDWLTGPGDNKSTRWAQAALTEWKKIFLNERI